MILKRVRDKVIKVRFRRIFCRDAARESGECIRDEILFAGPIDDEELELLYKYHYAG